MGSIYLEVVVPVKLNQTLTYSAPLILIGELQSGSYVEVELRKREVVALVVGVKESKPKIKGEIKEIIRMLETPPLPRELIYFYNWIGRYYLSTTGEVLLAANGRNAVNYLLPKEQKSKVKSGKKRKERVEWTLSPLQESALKECKESIEEGKPALLRGVTGSGKTQIYTTLAKEVLERGKSVLYMVPEIALSRQLRRRLEELFGEQLLLFHSATTGAAKREVRAKIAKGEEPYIVLGLRSAIFLPYSNLGLIIIDEEHDSSYKQDDPAPRYHGRDSALMMATLLKCGVVMGSATPSLESIYNAHSGKFKLVELPEPYYPSPPPKIEIIDSRRERRAGRMEQLFTERALEAIKERLERGEQVLLFRNRRSYSPLVQCLYCGDIPYCPNCNVSLNYHKRLSILKCHYCNYNKLFTTICTSCSKPGLKERGSGTEMVEEQLKELFPKARVARFDAETTSSKRAAEKILSQFEKGELDILVGTQMVSKGFDFEKLTLIVVLEADAMLSTDEFRASEKAMQLLKQLVGRSGRRENQGEIIVQSNQPDHPLYLSFKEGDDGVANELLDRREFGYPPFSRLIKVTLKHPSKEHLSHFAERVALQLPKWGINNFTGPVAPGVERVKREYLLNFWIKLERDDEHFAIKETLFKGVKSLLRAGESTITITFDSDPQ